MNTKTSPAKWIAVTAMGIALVVVAQYLGSMIPSIATIFGPFSVQQLITGTLVSACLTAVPGSSDVVRGGVVSYAVAVKRAVLGVSCEVLEDPALGAVSRECAEQMAAGARRVLGCDVAVSVTGIAGPGGAEPGKPVGTVWFGVSASCGASSRLELFAGGRDEVRHAAVRTAIRLLREAVMEKS